MIGHRFWGPCRFVIRLYSGRKFLSNTLLVRNPVLYPKTEVPPSNGARVFDPQQLLIAMVEQKISTLAARMCCGSQSRAPNPQSQLRFSGRIHSGKTVMGFT